MKPKKNLRDRKKILTILKNDLPFLKSTYGVSRIALFGSFSRGDQSAKSDVDIFVEFDRPIGLKFVRLAAHIEKKLGMKTDILTRGGISGIRVKSVVKNIKKNIIYV
jgi:hypothetical protein